tara:strand:- start:1849 stop:2172 length:324 start_codon:yes stop_codon:yes gene_type:complete
MRSALKNALYPGGYGKTMAHGHGCNLLRAAKRNGHEHNSPGCTIFLKRPGFGRRVANGGLGPGDTGGGGWFRASRRRIPIGRECKLCRSPSASGVIDAVSPSKLPRR